MRKSGLLLHITSLPSRFGIGDLGPEAYRFAEFLARSKQRAWQILPLNPPAPPRYSPYNSFSAFAGDTILISPELLYNAGLLTKREIPACPEFAQTRVEFTKVIAYKTKLLKTAYKRFKNYPKKQNYERFCDKNRSWLDDFALFSTLREHFRGKLWCDWPVELRDRKKNALAAIKTELRGAIEREKFLQYLFFEQWFALKRYCSRLGIEIIGDIPIYVAYDSADAWSHPEIFKLGRHRKPRFISGVPPDYFSKTGQLWGNPIYDWQVLKKTNYKWWLERLGHNLSMFDRVRIDHFRGFFAFWQVPARDKTAKNGRWVKGPGKEFFDALFKRFPKQSVIAEDLGHITKDVKSYIENAGLTGMRVLQFGFSPGAPGAKNPHFPKNHIKNSICYTGTHDNNTSVGWFKELNKQQKNRLFDCLRSLSLRGVPMESGRRSNLDEINWEMLRLAMSSAANLAIIPVQDILALGKEARMNHPAKTRGNWKWRLAPGKLTTQIAKKLAVLTKSSGR